MTSSDQELYVVTEILTNFKYLTESSTFRLNLEQQTAYL